MIGIKAYKWMLEYLENELGNVDTISTDLEDAGKIIFGKKFLGVFPSDMEPKNKEGYYILNLDKNGMPGSHWIAVVKEKDNIYQYDSFGRKINDLLGRGDKKNIDSDLDAEQSVEESNCGQRSLSWLWVFDQFGKTTAMTI